MKDSPIAALIMKLGKKPAADEYSVDEEAMTNQARKIIEGVKANDPSMVAGAIKEAVRLCEGAEGPAEDTEVD